ncbi:leucine-rich repeat-containing protein [Tanacetum coccineum]
MSNSSLFCIFFLFLFPTTFASSNFNDIHKCSKEESKALLLIRQNLSFINYTNDYLDDYSKEGWVDERCHWWLGSDYHPIKFNWNASTNCCNWNGVTCGRYTSDFIGIDLSCGMLKVSHISTSLVVTFLAKSHRISPSFIVSVGLSVNSDLKLMPHVLINLIHNATNCEKLSLQDVNISSVLPTSLNISSSLKLLDLYDTGLQGKLPHYLFNLHSLEKLDLSANSFIGNIPSEISVDITHLTYLNLARNKLNGTSPSWLFTSPCLENLRLSHNMLSGNVPFESFALPSLKELYLGYNNHFSGEWQLDTLLKTLTKLEYLDLSYNGLSVRAKNANHYVNPGFNYLGLASCKLKVLVLKSNNFHGPIGTSTATKHAFSRLQVLDLSHNWFVGKLPRKYFQNFKAMQKMVSDSTHPQYLSTGRGMHYYSIIVVVKDVQMTFTQLLVDYTIVDVSNNKFEGEIPNVIGSLKSLIAMNLSHDNLNGEIPNALGNILRIESLDLSWNQLTGHIYNNSVFSSL